MSRHTGQTSPKLDAHTEELQLAVLKQQNKHLMRETLPFTVTHCQQQVELNLLLIIAKQLKYQFFAVEQQLFLFLPDKISQVSRKAFLS